MDGKLVLQYSKSVRDNFNKTKKAISPKPRRTGRVGG